MKKIYLFIAALVISVMAFGQVDTIVYETFNGPGGFWEGPMNTNPNVSSTPTFSPYVMRFQNWNASNYSGASGGYHGILTDAIPTDTLRFSINSNGFDNLAFGMGCFSWGFAKGQFEFSYSTDGTNWTLFNEDALTSGTLDAAGWRFIVFSEVLPEADELSIKVYRTAPQVHFDDILVTGEPNNTNAFLSSLSLSVGDLDYRYYQDTYTVTLPYGTASAPIVTSSPFNSGATVTVTDATDINSMNDADRTTTVAVEAADGVTTFTYSILFNVTPPRADADLTGINLGYGMLAPVFTVDRLRYLVDLPDTATVTPMVTPVLSDAEGATVVQTDAVDISSVDVADRTTTIEVTAQDGVTTKTYEVVFKVGGNSTDLFVIDLETFGNVGNKFDVVLSEYEGFTSDFVWGDQLVHIRTSQPSTGYDLASAANRLEVQAGWGTGNDTIVFMANTEQFGNVTLATGVYNNSTNANGAVTAFKAYYSTDSVNWTAIGTETQGGTAFPLANAWSYVILDDVLPTDDSLYIMFANQDANFEYRLDDITLWGTPLNRNNFLGNLTVSEGTLDPVFDPSILSYTVSLPQGSSVTPTVTATAMEQNSIVNVLDATDIRSVLVEDNTTTIEVTAETGEVRTYSIVFDVFMSSVTTLADLTIGEFSLSPGFDNDIMSYAVKLPAGTVDAPEIVADPDDDYADVTITPPVDINSADVAERTAYIDVVAEDQLSSRSFEIVFTFGALTDVRFNILHEAFTTNGDFQAEAYNGYTSEAVFDGDQHTWANRNSAGYGMASGGSAVKFGNWGDSINIELVLKANVAGYDSIKLSFGKQHDSGGWGTDGCGLTNNFISIEYTIDSVNWMMLDKDSLAPGSSDWPCGGQPFSFVDLAETIHKDDMDYVTIRIKHNDGKIHPFYIDDIVLSGSPISTDATLASLTVSEGSLVPLFDSYVYEYSVLLPPGTTATPTLTPVASEDGAMASVADASDITSENVADRTSIVTVTAPDGVTTKEYSVVFNVELNNDALLSSLGVSVGNLNPVFNQLTFEYEVDLPAGTTATPTVTYETNDPNATADVTDATDVTSANIADRTTTITVTAEDGVTSLPYAIVFNVLVSVEDAFANTYQLYPNPVEGTLYITNADKIASVSVTNVVGGVVNIEQNRNDDQLQLNSSALTSGVYIITVTTTNGENLTTRFIKR